MSISYGGDKITATDGGSLNPLSAIFRNRLIDAGFIINQRGYVSNTALSAGTYAHDRWKAGASGCTYTFTQGSLGVPIVITITAGSLQQVIEGCNMPEGGTYTLSWTGTAQARFNGGTYGSSPLAITGITAGANTTIEFNTGTCSFPQIEVGTQATGFEYRQYGTELALCQRYYVKLLSNSTGNTGNLLVGVVESATTARAMTTLPTTMRSFPTVSFGGSLRVYDGSVAPTLTSIGTISTTTTLAANITASGGGLTVGRCALLINPASGSGTEFIDASAEL